MTSSVNVRLSPDGPFIGNPNWTLGDGSNGVILRKAGSGSAQQMNVTTPVTISGLSDIPIDLRPGYTYELDLTTEVIAIGLTADGQFHTVYRVRERNSSFWGSWTQFDAPEHYQEMISTTANVDAAYRDHTFNYQPTVACDRIEVGVVGALVNSTHNTLQPGGCRLRVLEHLP